MAAALDPARIPVLIAQGEVTDRPADPADAREPVVLMADALRDAEADAGAALIAAIDSIELVGIVGYPYRDPVGLLCEKLGIAPARAVNASMGGETPVRLVHEAALRIAAGTSQVAAIVGGEAQNALNKARKAGIELGWTPPPPPGEAFRAHFDRMTRPASRAVGVFAPVHIYPLYENAWTAAHGLTPYAGQQASAALWARFAAVAANNPKAWMQRAPGAEEIGTHSAANRPVAFPYAKLNVANPAVNQGGAVVVASLAWARAAGIAEERLIHIWGGAAANEPNDYLLRDSYAHSTAMRAVLARAVEIAGGDAAAFDLAELYSCFPIVPKMALEAMPLRADVEPTVAGGLTFFGGPLNNYMTHGICAMMRGLRSGTGELGLVYGQGGVVSKHHALVLGRAPAPEPLSPDVSVQAAADAARGEVPLVTEDYAGPATVETWTVLYAPDGAVERGVVLARTPAGERLIAQVLPEDEDVIARLTDWNASAVGLHGEVAAGPEGTLRWK
ncbi:acetyl-CoA acetyltransferase [Novosphingobium sp. Chol11]|uniref:acetyl-CoA acetyltransferase n=1 Tax=Novosphingobium sp. Chol11 TaxID=1385763 RepID=UPI0025DD8E76|nr:acetyl-CoA acetyltransferase [Novosphingobium sp. Chol11]